jgi:primosomal protein N''
VIPLPRMSENPPYRWKAAVVLDPRDVRRNVEALPKHLPQEAEHYERRIKALVAARSEEMARQKQQTPPAQKQRAHGRGLSQSV